MRGRPKRNPGRPAEPSGKRRTEPWLRIDAGLPLALVGNTVWRIKRRPVWNSWRQNWPPGRLLKAGRQRLGRSPSMDLWDPLSGVPRVLAAPPSPKQIAWDCRPLGWKPLPLIRRAARAGSRRAENTGNFKKSKVPAQTGRLNATQPAANGRQHRLHTWIDAHAQGSDRRGVARRSHTVFYSLGNISVSLTLWFYCARRSARRRGFCD